LVLVSLEILAQLANLDHRETQDFLENLVFLETLDQWAIQGQLAQLDTLDTLDTLDLLDTLDTLDAPDTLE
jgi:hypothetical protein